MKAVNLYAMQFDFCTKPDFGANLRPCVTGAFSPTKRLDPGLVETGKERQFDNRFNVSSVEAVA
jgi:hypothetical protein